MNHHPSTPPELIAPRYLAGPDTTATKTLIQHLRDHGWRAEPQGATLVLSHREPGGLLEALHTPDNTHTPRGKHPVPSWEFTARPGPGEPAVWTVRFGPHTPPELPATLTTALTGSKGATGTDGRPHYLHPAGHPKEATTLLSAAGWIWIRDLGRDASAWYSPDEQAIVVSPPTGEPEHDDGNWLLSVRRTTDNTTLWCATAHPRTPTHLMHALCQEIADPTPVPRRHSPGPETGPLTITRP
ncbi:DUF317 domain-containing protein [Streptomyces noursei]|uniref:DUF317 domain-containing protein n=1 Tax=Streptomyces noursei TaxID=1971 RepID=UPI001676B63A|nr:DUF317 domain-containing protein [Streptomyces noursei]MCZ1014808.1 DUF317 domain-containing protein [Streptomyces noursei]